MVALKKKKKIKKIVTKKKVKSVRRKVVIKKFRPKPKTSIKKKLSVLNLRRSKHNPIIEPVSHRYWESKATFNPTAFSHDGKVHIVYRAIGDSDNSVLGYVESDDGFTIKNSFPNPVYFHYLPFDKKSSLSPISYSSGGGWGGGCEDPRMTLLGNMVYMLYTAFDGWGSVRIALTSISLDDFISKRWNWKIPVLISPPGEIHKNWALFPEKINGKFAIFHSFAPKIRIDYFNSLDELDGTKFITSDNTRPIDFDRTWDSWFRGVGPAPIKTKYGWLVIYQAMDYRNADRYRIGAMILDEKDPTKVLFRSNQPILEPDEWYENEGYKSGVVYSCGAVIKDKQLFVYYGGADKVSCVATANLDKFLQEVVHSGKSVLKSGKIKK